MNESVTAHDGRGLGKYIDVVRCTDPCGRAGRPRLTGTCRGVGSGRARAGARLAAPGELAHLLELLAGGQLLGNERGLDAVEQPFQPADQLRLGDAELGLARHLTGRERQGQRVQLVLQVGRQRAGHLLDRAVVDLREPLAAGFVERAWRTSSSSCFTIEPMRITLRRFGDRLGRLDGAGSRRRRRRRADQLAVLDFGRGSSRLAACSVGLRIRFLSLGHARILVGTLASQHPAPRRAARGPRPMSANRDGRPTRTVPSRRDRRS